MLNKALRKYHKPGQYFPLEQPKKLTKKFFRSFFRFDYTVPENYPLSLKTTKYMTEFKNLSLKEIIAMIKSGETTQKEVYDYFVDRIKTLDPQVGAFNLFHETFTEQDIRSPLA